MNSRLVPSTEATTNEELEDFIPHVISDQELNSAPSRAGHSPVPVWGRKVIDRFLSPSHFGPGQF
jgi:hypothetical protein